MQVREFNNKQLLEIVESGKKLLYYKLCGENRDSIKKSLFFKDRKPVFDLVDYLDWFEIDSFFNIQRDGGMYIDDKPRRIEIMGIAHNEAKFLKAYHRLYQNINSLCPKTTYKIGRTKFKSTDSQRNYRFLEDNPIHLVRLTLRAKGVITPSLIELTVVSLDFVNGLIEETRRDDYKVDELRIKGNDFY